MSLIFEDDDSPVVINKYEITSIVRERTLQLRDGDPSRLPQELIKDIFDEQRIAELEIEHHVCPVGVKKRMRNGKYEIVYIRGGEIIVTN